MRLISVLFALTHAQFALLGSSGFGSSSFGSSGGAGSTSSSLVLRSLIESLERNLVSKIQSSERQLRDQINDLSGKLANVEARLNGLEKKDAETDQRFGESEAKITSFGLKIDQSTARVANQMGDNLNIMGMSLQQMTERVQGLEQHNRELYNQVDELVETAAEMTTQIQAVDAKAGTGGGGSIDEQELKAMMNKLQGGPNLINIEMRLSTLEDRFDDDLEVKIQNKTDAIVSKLTVLENSNIELIGSVENMQNLTGKINGDLASTVTKLDDLSFNVEMSSTQTSALGDALAGSYQQYASLSMQIMNLRNEVDDRSSEIEVSVMMLNSTIDEVAEQARSSSEAAQLFEQVFKLEQRTMILEQSNDEFKSRLEFTAGDFDSMKESMQSQLTQMQEFQQTEGARQQEQWATQKNFTSSVNSHIVTVQDSLASLKSSTALQSEKITMALNNADKAEKAAKLAQKKAGKIDTVSNELSSLKTSQANYKQTNSGLITSLQDKLDQLSGTVSNNVNSIKTVTTNADANAEKLVHMKKIKSDIDLIKYTLNSQSTTTAVARGGVSGGAVVPSAQLDALRAMIESTNTDLTELEIATNTVKNQLHVLKDDLSNQQLTVVASSKKLENEIESSKAQCEMYNDENLRSLATLKTSLSSMGDDLADFKETSTSDLDMVSTSISNVQNAVEDFTHSQKTLTSFVQSFKQDVEISIAGYLSSFQQYIQKRTKGTQTTVRYIAASSDKFNQADGKMVVPFNDIVTDPIGAANNQGIIATVPGQYHITAQLAGTKGTIVYVLVQSNGGTVKESIRVYETAWNSMSSTIVLNLAAGDRVSAAISSKGKLVDGKYNYLTMGLAEPSMN